MHGALENHERDCWTSSQCHQSRGDSTVWNTVDDYMLYVRCAAFFDTLSREFLMLITTGRSEDIRLALRRREQRDEEQEEQCCESSGGSVGAQKKALPRGNRGTPWKKAPNDCDQSTDCYLRQHCDVVRTMRDVRESVQRIPLTMVERDPETMLTNRTVLASTGKRPVEIERPFCPH